MWQSHSLGAFGTKGEKGGCRPHALRDYKQLRQLWRQAPDFPGEIQDCPPSDAITAAAQLEIHIRNMSVRLPWSDGIAAFAGHGAFAVISPRYL